MRTAQATGSGVGLVELIREARTVEKALRQLPRREEGFPMGGRAVLQALLEHGLQTVPQIAVRRGTSRQNIQVLVNRLKADGWVEMTDNPAHRRSELIRLTGNGRAVVEKLTAEETVFLDGLAAQISAEEVKAAVEVLRRLRELLEGEGERREPRVRKRQKELPVSVLPEEEKRDDAGSGDELQEGELPVNLL